MDHTFSNAEPHPRASEWAAEHTAQLEKSLQTPMRNLRDEKHIPLTNLDSKVEQLSESFHGMGQTFQAHADSVHTEVLRLRSAFQSRPPR